MTTKPPLTPEEKLSVSRSEIVSFMQNNNQVLDILKPVVASYAKSDPLKTLGIAAGVGAAIIVFKPWRLISIGALLGLLKSRM
jgi:ElaB/YqjD/DUF883 family membrane-anchored ribosome-binding protein